MCVCVCVCVPYSSKYKHFLSPKGLAGACHEEQVDPLDQKKYLPFYKHQVFCT